jgi:CSLREA domain-containing protein
MKSHPLFTRVRAVCGRKARVPRPRLPLRLELLEDRWVPAVFNVNSTADIFAPAAGTVTLRSAIQAANTTPGPNSINLTVAGTYRITLPGANTGSDSTGAFAILPTGGDLTITNTSGGMVTVDGNHLDRVFDINPPGGTGSPSFTVTMQGFTIQNGFAQPGDGAAGSGGGIRDQGNASLVLNNTVVTNNAASADGGGVAMENGASTPWKLTINNSTITLNRAGDAGGGVETDGSGNVSITTSVISANTAVNQGAGVWLDAIGPGTITNPAILNGGTGYTSAPTVTFTGGGATTQATGVATIANGAVTGVTITANGEGYTSAPTIMFTGGGGSGAAASTTVNNTFLSANLVITGSLIDHNNTSAVNFGGGVGNAGNGSVTINASTVSNNFSGGNGGGFADENGVGTLTVLNSTFANNSSVLDGGGIYEGSATTTTINNATVTGNSSLGNAGGIEVLNGQLVLNNTIVAGNFAGPMNFVGGTVTDVNVTNGGTGYTTAPTVTFTNAPGDTTGSGATATATLTGDTVTAVDVTNGGTGYTLPPLVSFTGGGGTGAAATAEIVGGAPDILSGNTTGSGNFIGINDGNEVGLSPANGNQIGTVTKPLNPGLGPLQNNGGPTPTELPLAGSSVINAGVVATIPAGVTKDQRGFPRTINNLVDVGAVQSQLTTTGSNFATLGAYRPSDGSWSLDSNGIMGFQPGVPPAGDRVIPGFSPAGTTVVPVSGDWTGNGRSKIGDFQSGTWHLDLNDNGTLDPGETFLFGQAGDVPVPGNYFGDGLRLAVFRAAPDGVSGEFVISDLNWRTEPVIGIAQTFVFGLATDKVVVGDWTGDGITKVGVFRAATAFGNPNAAVFTLDTTNAHAFVPGQSKVFVFGLITDGVVIGDWDGSGTSKVGVYRPATAFGAPNTAVFSLDQHGKLDFNQDGVVFLFGLATDKYVTGKWASVTAQTELAAGGPAAVPSNDPPLTVQQLLPVVQEARARLEATGLDPTLVAALQQERVVLGTLGGGALGEEAGDTITIDPTAAGYGWYVDGGPSSDAAFPLAGSDGLHAVPGSNAATRMDLLTVVMHEYGHVLGLPDVDATLQPGDLMADTLPLGVRRNPGA